MCVCQIFCDYIGRRKTIFKSLMPILKPNTACFLEALPSLEFKLSVFSVYLIFLRIWDTESEELILNDFNWTSPFSVPKMQQIVAK